MKHAALLFFTACLLALSLQNCKPDPQITPPNGEPDSLFVGTKYTITKPFRFPSINNAGADSLTVEGIELGRRLFYDKHLSSTGALSCASCHKQELAFSDAGNAKSQNVFGPTKRNAPAIQNLLWDGNIFWDGRAGSLAAQAQDAFHGEQDLNVPAAITYLQGDSTYVRLFKKAFGRPGDITEGKIYTALQQFMMTLISSESRFDSIQRGAMQFTASEQRGFQIFATETGDCFHCHALGNTWLMTDNAFHNNGLDSVTTADAFIDLGRGFITGNSNDNGKFKSPSLRNLEFTAPYMHDGRFQTLEQVIDFYSEGIKLSPTVDAIMLKANHANGGVHLDAQQKADLLAFLKTLNDYRFVSNPGTKDPF
ncbi:MAG: cytochrome c peroxidase [Chitinophagales bacterium]